ncbi:MAG: hypothetical protein NZ521_02150 [Flammeovirgaceae bacterium]|nr:hypothetical protein [Flammeovirgaceae bacterium]MDW8286915.1 hypothetical protein [Flammeovirgaceae bacterium]
MITVIFFLMATILGTTAQAQKKYPCIEENMRITFSVNAPNAKEVRLIWETEKSNRIPSSELLFQQKDSGIWQLSIPPLPPDVYFYAFQIDAKHQRDMLNPNVFYKNGMPYSLLTVPIFAHDNYHAPIGEGIFYGEIQNRTYFSKKSNLTTEFNCYVPYREYWQDSLPIVFLLHDEQFRGTDWFLVGNIQWLLDHLLQKHAIQPALVVMPTLFLSAKKKNSHAASGFQEEEIIQLITELWESFPQAERKAHLISIGTSAERSFRLCANYPHLFDKVAVLSGDIVRDETLLHQISNKTILVADAMEGVATPAALHRQLEQKGIAHDNYQMRGIRRNWVFWKHVLYERFFPTILSVTPR